MRVYLAKLELHGPLFFSGETKHALTSASHLLVAPKAILSPIALTYALNNLPAEAYAWKVEEGPKYELLKKFGRFSYGALPIRVRYRRFFFSIKGMSWGEYRGRSKVNWPRMVTMVAITPPSSFRTAFVTNESLPPSFYLRIGTKRSGVMKVWAKEAEIRESEGTLTLPMSKELLEHFGCEVRGFASLLTTPFAEIGLAEVEKCKVVRACVEERCERLAIPSQ